MHSPVLVLFLGCFAFHHGAEAQGLDVAPRYDAAPESLYEHCYRYGRCEGLTREEARRLMQRAGRLSPSAPQAAGLPVRTAKVEPTPAENIQPDFRSAGTIREEFGRSGQPLETAKTGSSSPR